MGYISTRRPPERILIYGDAGSRKSTAILDLAKRLPGQKFRVVDCDWSPSTEVLMGLPKYEQLTNVEVRVALPDDWDAQLAGLEWMATDGKAGDWAAFDSFTHTWEGVQEWYIEHMFPGFEHVEDYYLKKRAEKAGQEGDLDGWMDWSYIKKVHTRAYRHIAKMSSHFVMTMEQQAVSQDRLNGEEKAVFGTQKSMPKGRKQIAHVPQTIVHFEVDRNGRGTFTTLKDRGRELQVNHELTDFFRDYLISPQGGRWVREVPAFSGEQILGAVAQLTEAPAEGVA